MRLALPIAIALVGCLSPTPGEPEPAPVAFPAIRFETELGPVTAIAFCNETPRTCAFMETLVRDGYYDGRGFGRVIPGFVIQEVDRTGGTTDQPERVAAEFGTRVRFSAGALGIARDADPDSGGSEFFVMDFAYGPLYGNYTAFAQVVDGLDVVRAIARVPAVRTGPASSVVGSPPGSPVSFGVHDRVPVDPVAITRAEWTALELPAADAARYPLQVGDTTRTDAYRATLEWPRDLRAGRASELVWYVAPRDASPQGQVQDPPPVDLAGATIRIEGASAATLTPAEDALRGILRASWTPTAAGDHRVWLTRNGEDLALANLTVP